MRHQMTDSRMTNATIHESPRISGDFCNGCLCLEVLTERRKKKEPKEKYYCTKRRCYVIPKAVKECKSRCLTVPKVDMPNKFNRGY